MARRVRSMRGERANSRQLGPQDTARAAIGHPYGYELQFAGLISVALADLIAFGRPYIANPDLAERLKHGWPLAEADPSSFYTRRGIVGYTDFPAYSVQRAGGR